MRLSAIAALAFGAVLVTPITADASGDAANSNQHHRVYHHAAKAEKIRPHSAAQVPREPALSLFPYFSPYPRGQGDTDGLSRRPDDCNKGCIGGNPS
ncbi:MAG: hypothetical protein ACLQIB_21010 [Isosphaeraceae bacterium]